MMADPSALAIEYLLATRTAAPAGAAELERELATLDPAHLHDALANDGARTAFWVDVYNAAVLRRPAYDFSSWRTRSRFFSRSALTVAGRLLSLDAIEHGILRRSRLKLGLGYAANPAPSSFERQQRVRRVDPRIHFALNCAAASCPPIAAYRAEHIETQLEIATRSYLQQTARLAGGRLEVPAVFLWFIADFGGPPGVRRFLQRHDIEGWGRPLRFGAWDWTPRPGRWAVDEVT